MKIGAMNISILPCDSHKNIAFLAFFVFHKQFILVLDTAYTNGIYTLEMKLWCIIQMSLNYVNIQISHICVHVKAQHIVYQVACPVV